jgi:hypothetical protein
VQVQLLESELLGVEMWMVPEVPAFAKGLKKSEVPEGAEVDSARQSLELRRGPRPGPPVASQSVLFAP